MCCALPNVVFVLNEKFTGIFFDVWDIPYIPVLPFVDLSAKYFQFAGFINKWRKMVNFCFD